jgi:shikimate dehydrogenase/3-dehydroquinate dehydratase type I
MQLIVTIYEETFAAALEAIRGLAPDCDGVELRAERFGPVDLHALRRSTPKLLILTYRGMNVDEATIAGAREAGIDLVDVEYHERLDRDLIARYRERLVLSHHDYQRVPENAEALAEAMLAFRCAHTKLAATPGDFGDNQRMLALLRRQGVRDGGAVTVIGMGERGLYSRVAAPFFGSALMFVARTAATQAAPGQLELERALPIFGDRRLPEDPALFAIAGDPSGHSLSPAFHNARFREHGVAAAYTFASFSTLDEIAVPLVAGSPFAPLGLSITAPFKQEAFAFALRQGAEVGENARGCGSVNTLVKIGDRLVADNTDVDGFAVLLAQLCGRDRKSVAILGAGGTARAALAAVARTGMHVTVYNRTLARAQELVAALGGVAAPLEEVARFDGEVVIDTLSDDIDPGVPLHAGSAYLRAAYGKPSRLEQRAREAGAHLFGGRELFQAQAVRQNELFTQAVAARIDHHPLEDRP